MRNSRAGLGTLLSADRRTASAQRTDVDAEKDLVTDLESDANAARLENQNRLVEERGRLGCCEQQAQRALVVLGMLGIRLVVIGFVGQRLSDVTAPMVPA